MQRREAAGDAEMFPEDAAAAVRGLEPSAEAEAARAAAAAACAAAKAAHTAAMEGSGRSGQAGGVEAYEMELPADMAAQLESMGRGTLQELSVRAAGSADGAAAPLAGEEASQGSFDMGSAGGGVRAGGRRCFSGERGFGRASSFSLHQGSFGAAGGVRAGNGVPAREGAAGVAGRY